MSVLALPRTLALITFVSVCCHAAAEDPSTVLILVNDATPPEDGTGASGASVYVGEYYAAKRAVPAQNILHLNVNAGIDPRSWDGEFVTFATFDTQIRQPVKAFLESNGLKNKIKYIVPTYGIPNAIHTSPVMLDGPMPQYFPSEGFSVDSYLASLYSGTDDLFLTNPYAISDPAYMRAHFRSWTNPLGWPMYLVTRLDGPSAIVAAGLVDKALQAEVGLSPTSGTGYFDWQNSGTTTDQTMKRAYDQAVQRAFPAVLNDQSITGNLIQNAPNTLWAWGWYSGSTDCDCYSFVNGALGAQLTSYTAIRIRSYGPGTWVPVWLNAGITATWGATSEPYTSGYAKGDNLLNHFWMGYNFAESAYLAAPALNWMMVFIGDPLYSPPIFATGITDQSIPRVSLTGTKTGQFYSGNLTVSISLSSTPPVAGVQFLLEGDAIGGEITSAPYTATFGLGNEWYGPLSFTARIRYASGANLISDPVAFILNNQESVIPVTVQTNPSGRSFSVDGTNYSSTQVLNWIPGSTHTIAAPTTQSGESGTQYIWNTWSDGGALSHTVTPNGATTYTANFTTQYLLTTNVSPGGGGTITASPVSASGYYDNGTSVQLTAAATGSNAFTGWSGDLSDSTNPQSVTMSASRTVTASFQPPSGSATSFLTGFALNSPPQRNDFGSFVGMKLTVGATPITVTALGRIFVTGNTGTHTVKFVRVSDGVDVPGGSVSISMTGGTAGQFQYVLLASPVTLLANTAYYLVSQEAIGGDTWYEYDTVSSTSVATVNSSVYLIGTTWYPIGAANTSYVPPNFQYSVVTPTPISVTVQATPVGPSITADGSTSTTAQTLAWTSGTSHTISTASPQSAGAGTQYAWSGWSDGGAISHTVAPVSNVTYTASFTTQYLLTTTISPAASGSVSAGGYYDSGASVQLTATPSAGCTFQNWSGALSGATNPQPVTMSSPQNVTANFQCSGPPPAGFITGYALSGQSLRSDFTGWVGMKLTVGANPLTVSALGRICVANNVQTHAVKFVDVGDGSDVVVVSVNMAGCAPNQFAYASITPITLPAGTSYYLVSQETQNGDQWYDESGISATNVAAVNSAVYSYNGVWYPIGEANTSYVPPNFQYSVVTPDPNPPFVTGYNLNNRRLRSDFTGWVGLKLTTGPAGMSVNALGRIFVSGNTGNHLVKLVRASDGTDVQGASVSVVMSGGASGQFQYVSLPSAVTLQANTAYYLVTQELFGGDQWYDYGTVSTTSSAAVNSAVYSPDGTTWVTLGDINTSYVPPNLK